MDTTVSLMAKTLGAHGVESAGSDARFAVEGSDGSVIKVSIEGRQQRFMAVLIDAAGVTRTSLDVAPVSHVLEDKSTPGRVTLHLGKHRIHIDSRPIPSIEMVTSDD